MADKKPRAQQQAGEEERILHKRERLLKQRLHQAQAASEKPSSARAETQ